MSSQVIAIRPNGRGDEQLEGYQRSYERTYLVQVGDVANGRLAAALASGLPLLGSIYQLGSEADLGARLTGRTYEQIDKWLWDVTCRWESREQDGDPDEETEDPEFRPWQIGISFDTVLSYPLKDKDGKPWANSAGQPFASDIVATPERIMVIDITRNETSFPLAVASDYQDAINSDTWMGFDADTVKINKVSTRRFWEHEAYYFDTSYQLAVTRQEGGWLTQVQDKGDYWWKDGNVGGDKLLDLDATGQPTGREVYLSDGDKLAETAVLAGNVNELERRKYDRQSFAALNLEF